MMNEECSYLVAETLNSCRHFGNESKVFSRKNYKYKYYATSEDLYPAPTLYSITETNVHLLLS